MKAVVRDDTKSLWGVLRTAFAWGFIIAFLASCSPIADRSPGAIVMLAPRPTGAHSLFTGLAGLWVIWADAIAEWILLLPAAALVCAFRTNMRAVVCAWFLAGVYAFEISHACGVTWVIWFVWHRDNAALANLDRVISITYPALLLCGACLIASVMRKLGQRAIEGTHRFARLLKALIESPVACDALMRLSYSAALGSAYLALSGRWLANVQARATTILTSMAGYCPSWCNLDPNGPVLDFGPTCLTIVPDCSFLDLILIAAPWMGRRDKSATFNVAAACGISMLIIVINQIRLLLAIRLSADGFDWTLAHDWPSDMLYYGIMAYLLLRYFRHAQRPPKEAPASFSAFPFRFTSTGPARVVGYSATCLLPFAIVTGASVLCRELFEREAAEVCHSLARCKSEAELWSVLTRGCSDGTAGLAFGPQLPSQLSAQQEMIVAYYRGLTVYVWMDDQRSVSNVLYKDPWTGRATRPPRRAP